MLEEKSNILRWLVCKVPSLRDSKVFRSEVVDCPKDTLRAYKLVEAEYPVLNELLILEKKSQKLDEVYAEWVQIKNQKIAHMGL